MLLCNVRLRFLQRFERHLARLTIVYEAVGQRTVFHLQSVRPYFVEVANVSLAALLLHENARTERTVEPLFRILGRVFVVVLGHVNVHPFLQMKLGSALITGERKIHGMITIVNAQNTEVPELFGTMLARVNQRILRMCFADV